MTRSSWKVGLRVFNTGKINFNFFLMKYTLKNMKTIINQSIPLNIPKSSQKQKQKTENPKTFRN